MFKKDIKQCGGSVKLDSFQMRELTCPWFARFKHCLVESVTSYLEGRWQRVLYFVLID